MSGSAWISAGKISAALVAVALVFGAIFQGQPQQRSEMADVRAELRNGTGQVNVRIDGISRDLTSLRERVARSKGLLALLQESEARASGTPRVEQGD